VRVKGHLVKFDEDTLNTFLKTAVVLEEGENLCTYSRFALLRPDPQELAAKLCIPGRGFELNADGQPLKILRKNMTMLAQTWSVLSLSNLIRTSHKSDVTLDRAKLIYGIIMKMDMNLGYLISHQISRIAQHDKSRLGFLAVATCPFAGERGEPHGCAFQRRKDARSHHQRLFVENIGKIEGNRSK